MTAKRDGSTGMIEPANSRAFDESSPKASNTADQVNNAGAGEIYDAGAKQKVSTVGGTGPSITGPEPVRNYRVDETGKERRVD